MESETQDGILEFNLDALTDGNSGTPSLSDLFGIPVFTKEIGQSSEKLTDDRDKKIDQMQEEVFFINDESTKEVDVIREKVFLTTVLAKDKEYEPERVTSSTTYVVVSIVLFCFIIIFSTLYAKKKNRERKKYLETIDDFI